MAATKCGDENTYHLLVGVGTQSKELEASRSLVKVWRVAFNEASGEPWN